MPYICRTDNIILAYWGPFEDKVNGVVSNLKLIVAFSTNIQTDIRNCMKDEKRLFKLS